MASATGPSSLRVERRVRRLMSSGKPIAPQPLGRGVCRGQVIVRRLQLARERLNVLELLLELRVHLLDFMSASFGEQARPSQRRSRAADRERDDEEYQAV